MLVTMKNSETIDQLVLIANGDIELVKRAIAESANSEGAADLKLVVDYILSRREQATDQQEVPQHVAA
jgi:hypothetical protein